jgi:insulysin
MVTNQIFISRTVQTQNFENGDNNPVWQNNFEFKSSLLQNGLKLILIRDPNATKAAASLYIGAGSMNEPPNMNGLAHLLEHVVFSGNAKYPQQDFFETYAASNGGGVSAYVGMDHTHYAISCLPDAIEGAVDR